MKDIISTIDMAGWVFAGFLCIINIVLVYLIVPAKRKITKVSDKFHRCQLKGKSALSTIQSEQESIKNTMGRHDQVIEDTRKCMHAVEVKLGRLEEVAKKNGELLGNVDDMVKQLLHNGNK